MVGNFNCSDEPFWTIIPRHPFEMDGHFKTLMGTKLRNLRPREAFEDAVRRSIAAGFGAFLAVGVLNTSGAIPARYSILVTVSGMEAAFLSSLTLLVAYYHRRWRLGILGAVLSLLLPYFVSLAWIGFSARSLIYPIATLLIVGGVTVEMIHRKISGPQPDDDSEEAQLRNFIEEMDFNLTWVDRVTWLCFTVGVVMLFILMLR